MKLEELLNKLIEKGYRPFGKKAEHCLGCRYNNDWSEMYKYVGFIGGDDVVADRKVPLRSLVSKESNLWQFVCENGMANELYDSDDRAKNYDGYANECDDCYGGDDYGYRLIEASLKDESELEQFLLSNIVIKDEE